MRRRCPLPKMTAVRVRRDRAAFAGGVSQCAADFRKRDPQQRVDSDQKLNRAEIAQEMEGRKQGENMEILDPASLPESPTEPKRPMVISIGAAIGLLLGMVFAGAREVKDSSLKNLKDVRAYTQMAILANVPRLENDSTTRRRSRLNWLGWTTASLAAAVMMAGTVAYYYMTMA